MVERAGAGEDITGILILDVLTRDPNTVPVPEHLYCEFHESGFRQAMLTGDWKSGCHSNKGGIELYNLASDLSEEHNVAAKHTDVVVHIAEQLIHARTESEH